MKTQSKLSNSNFYGRSLTTLLPLFLLTACGSGGNDGGGEPFIPEPPLEIGQFKDSNTTGLSYVSGNQSGVSDENGKFTYEAGNTVTFLVGGVELGTSTGQSIVTPLDLEFGGTSGSLKVQNITRFLMMLDEDGNPANGISISPSIQESAQNWSQVDFDSTDLPTELTAIISGAKAADGGDHILPTAEAAKSHLESTLRCVYAGAYKGDFSGGDSGYYGVLVDAATGFVEGFAYSTQFNQPLALSGTRAFSYDQSRTFVSGSTSTGATFDGRFDSTDNLSGSWQSPLYSGSFLGSRIGGDKDAVYRLTGSYTGNNDGGLFSFDVDGSENVTGVAYSVFTDELFNLTGTLSESNLMATATNGTEITGTLGSDNQITAGTWNNPDNGQTGGFTGTGCELN